MPFVFEVHPGHRTGLVAVCDVCGERIEDPGMACIVWRPDLDEKVGARYPYQLVCKGPCDRVLESQGHNAWQELDTGLIYLLNNLHLGEPELRQARVSAALLSQLE